MRVLLWTAVVLAACGVPPGAEGDGGVAPFHAAIHVQAGAAAWELPVPPGSVAGLVHVSGAPLDVQLLVTGWDQPDGVLVPVDAGRALTLAEQEWSQDTGLGVVGPCRVRPGCGAAAFGCPNGDDQHWTPGRHHLRLRATRLTPDGGVPWDGIVQVDGRFSVAPPANLDLPLTVRLHLAPGLGLPDGVAPTYPPLQTTLDRARGLLVQAGVVPRFELRAAPRSVVVLDGKTLRSEALLDLTAVMPPAPGVDVFVLGTLQVEGADGLNRDVESLVTSLPLAAGQQSVAGLLLMHADWTTMDPQTHQLWGTLLAHELGHALNLFHPVEAVTSDGTFVTDLLADTPDAQGSTAGYLMHYAPTRNAVMVTPSQRSVLRLSPNLQ